MLKLSICFLLIFGGHVAFSWDYTDDIGREWETQDPRSLPEISVETYLKTQPVLADTTMRYGLDMQLFYRALKLNRLSLELALAITKNMTQYCERIVTVTEDDFGAAYAAYTSSERVLQAMFGELTENEREMVKGLEKEVEESRERRFMTMPRDGAKKKRDASDAEFYNEEIRRSEDESDNGFGYYYEYEGSGEGSGDVNVTEAPTEAPPEYDHRLWPAIYKGEFTRNVFFKNSQTQLKEALKQLYELRKIFNEAEEEINVNKTVNLLDKGSQELQQFILQTDTRALYSYIGIHHFATFSEPYSVYPQRGKDDLNSLWFKLVQSRTLANAIASTSGSFYPVKYWQDYDVIDKPDFDCETGTLSVVDCPLTYLKKHGITALDIQKFDPWLTTFNKGRRIRVESVSVRLGGARVVSSNTNSTEDKVTMEIYNAGMCKDYYLFEEHIFQGGPVHLKYVYDQATYEQRLLQPIHTKNELYHAETTPFAQWVIVFDKILNPELDLSDVTDLRISWSGEASLQPYP